MKKDKSDFENFTYEQMLSWIDQEAQKLLTEKKIKNQTDTIGLHGGSNNVQKRVDS